MNKLKILFLFFLVYCHSIQLFASCNNKKAPLCPEKGSLALNEQYPASAYIVSTASKMYSENGQQMTPNFLLSVMEAYSFDDKLLPALIIPTSAAEFKRLQETMSKALSEKKIPRKKREMLLSSMKNIETSSYLWQQDFMQSLFDSDTGSPTAGIISRYDRTPSGIERGYTNQKFNCSPISSERVGSSQKMRPHSIAPGLGLGKNGFGMPDFAPPGVDNEQWYEGEPGDVNSKMGGNIESLPAGICLTGNNMSEEYLKQWCRDPQMAVKVDTEWLTVGHVDELVKLIPSDDKAAPCNFSIMTASPEKALDLLKNDPNEDFYTYNLSKDDSSETHLKSKLTNMYFPGEVMCKLYQDSIRSMEEQEKANSPSYKIKNAWLLDLIFSPALAYDYPGAICEQELERMKKITNGQYYRALIADDDLRETNRIVQNKMNQAKKDITRQLKRFLPQCGEPRFIDVPNIFVTDGLVDGEKGKELPLPGSGNSILPNPTNSVVANKTVIFPDPNNATFKAYLKREIEKTKIRASFVDTWDASHLGHGNLHCITNSFRYCRPNTK